jgi:hypothetical protein
MLAPATATSETMRRAVAYTIAALDAATDLDIDRTNEDRAFFANEKANLEPLFQALNNNAQAIDLHSIKEGVRLQARAVLGDAVLDRGVSQAKQQMKLSLQTSKPEAADIVFGASIADLIRAEMRSEPLLVRQALERLEQAPDFPNKSAMKGDLAKRVEQQMTVLTGRDDGEVTRARLDSLLVKSIADCSEALYKLEKRLLERFPRDRAYVKEFFLDVAPPRRAKDPIPAGM